MGQNDLKGKIKGPADLKDRTIGISAIGSGSWAFANLLAHLGSLDASRDIKIVPLGNMTAIISALKTNRVDVRDALGARHHHRAEGECRLFDY